VTDYSPYQLGRSGERRAVEYLKRKGFRVVETGFRMFHGEIDIIAYEGDTLVFLEVKTRRGREFGAPEESVTPFKQRRIRRVAEGYLFKKRLEQVPCRFDVLAVEGDEERGFSIRHFPDAFE